MISTSPSNQETAFHMTARSSNELRGEILEVLRVLLQEGRSEEVFALVSKLISRNSELEKRLTEILNRGKKREGISTAQLHLFLNELSKESHEELNEANARLREKSGIDEKESEEAKTEKPRRQPPLRRPIPSHLRRIENIILVPKEERACPTCGALRECMGHDVTEVIELIPAEVVVRQDKREKLVCKTCEGKIVRAGNGDKVVEGGRMGSTLVSCLLVDKYRDGLPLNRQKQRFERCGLKVSLSTLGDQVMWATDLLRPLWRAAMAQVLLAKVMHLDGTGLEVLDRSSPGHKKLGSLWGYVGNQMACYLYMSTGKKKGETPGELGPEDVLSLRKGYTVADASVLFDSSFKREDLIECGCNMHARRYFTKALDRGDTRASLPLAAFKKLYEIEEKIRALDAQSKRDERQAQSKPIYDELISWCQTHEPYEPPSSPMGAALRYLLNHQLALCRFLEDGDIPIDNGVVERLHVRTALTRKNFLFAGSDAGAERAAIAYTILGCCQLAEVNPLAYLSDVLPRLSRRIRLVDVPSLLPIAWKNHLMKKNSDDENQSL
jgi:transposase